jgi:oxygen-independent coproporphyrinogen-3 oxidase
LPSETEVLSKFDIYNEYVMTGLRTIWGVSLLKIEIDFGSDYLKYILKQSEKHLLNELLFLENQILKPTAKGKFLTDGIASDLFKIAD